MLSIYIYIITIIVIVFIFVVVCFQRELFFSCFHVILRMYIIHRFIENVYNAMRIMVLILLYTYYY